MFLFWCFVCLCCCLLLPSAFATSETKACPLATTADWAKTHFTALFWVLSWEDWVRHGKESVLLVGEPQQTTRNVVRWLDKSWGRPNPTYKKPKECDGKIQYSTSVHSVERNPQIKCDSKKTCEKTHSCLVRSFIGGICGQMSERKNCFTNYSVRMQVSKCLCVRFFEISSCRLKGWWLMGAVNVCQLVNCFLCVCVCDVIHARFWNSFHMP